MDVLMARGRTTIAAVGLLAAASLLGGCGGGGGAATTGISPQAASAPPGGTIIWTDDIQNGSPPWGFDLIQCQHSIDTEVACSDANGANVSVVADPAGGTGKAMRHYIVTSGSGGRTQAGVMSLFNSAFATQLANHGEVWIEEEAYFPSMPTPSGNYPWLSIMDFHSTDSAGDNRWHTNPGLFLCATGIDCSSADTGKLKARNFTDSIEAGPTTITVPIGRWFKLQVHWVWSTSAVPITYWIDGVQVLQITMATRDPLQTAAEWYDKWYGYDQGGAWSPDPLIRYTRNIRMSDAFISN